MVDEYDKPMLDVMDVDKSLEEEHRNILKGFYSAFKGADKHLQFVFLTGVTKFSQVSVFSGFNQPEEMESYFKEGITKMAGEYGCTYDKMKERLKARYYGYHFSSKLTDVYNPSVCSTS